MLEADSLSLNLTVSYLAAKLTVYESDLDVFGLRIKLKINAVQIKLTLPDW